MIRTNSVNINTDAHWSEIYKTEAKALRQRVDAARMAQLIRWSMIRQGEIQRAVEIYDVSCGLGDVAKATQFDPKIMVNGIDISEAAIDHCKKEFGPRDRWNIASAEQLPAMSETYDVVWIGETLEHLERPTQAIREAARVCREEGFVVISTPYRGRNRSDEHVWEFDPSDVQYWAAIVGELVYLDCCLLDSWCTMFAVFRRAHRVEPS